MSAFIRIESIIATAITVLITLLVVAYQISGFISESKLLPIILSLVLVYSFLTIPLTKKTNLFTKFIDWALSLGSIITGFYLAINFTSIVQRSGMPNSIDIYMGILAIILLLEALRRTVGWGLTIISLFFLLYAFLGPYFPDFLRHRGYSLDRVSSQLYLGTSGLYGLPLATMFRYVIIFIIFGAVLEKTGVSDFMVRLSQAITGRLPGGTGHISVLSSGLMGSVSGSAVANVMVGGNVTIPAMAKSGFSKRMAGSIEAVSSNGGQILPPVMGAAAFLMAENLQIPYTQVALAAIIPGLLYFLMIGSTVHFYATKNNIHGLKKSEIQSLFSVIKSGWIYPIPFIVLIGMMVLGYSPSYSGLGATISGVICGFINPKHRLTFKGLFEAIISAGRGVVMLCVASAGAGIVMGVLTLTGLGNRFSAILVDLSGNSIVLLVIFAMIGAIVMGMGMPTTVVYILLAALIAPSLIEMGINPIAAHLFILYFGTISMLTPPVALASYAAAAISGDNPDKTGWAAFKIALPAYIIPFCFIFNNGLLMQGGTLVIIKSIILTVMGVIFFSSVTQGFLITNLTVVERLIILACALMLMSGNIILGVVSLIVIGFAVYRQNVRYQASSRKLEA